ncbi:hypothetical protein BB560_006782 [Smittium megazygosporum]|uniref:Uncharacterized protein n=1 Tax=Smittium megazygosporum TaxID=133381 RepID=A0A2T9Y1N9_9FUNG|nr:hypothetical protein BB560_006782 [Smittium megazygosporum]
MEKASFNKYAKPKSAVSPAQKTHTLPDQQVPATSNSNQENTIDFSSEERKQSIIEQAKIALWNVTDITENSHSEPDISTKDAEMIPSEENISNLNEEQPSKEHHHDNISSVPTEHTIATKDTAQTETPEKLASEENNRPDTQTGKPEEHIESETVQNTIPMLTVEDEHSNVRTIVPLDGIPGNPQSEVSSYSTPKENLQISDTSSKDPHDLPSESKTDDQAAQTEGPTVSKGNTRHAGIPAIKDTHSEHADNDQPDLQEEPSKAVDDLSDTANKEVHQRSGDLDSEQQKNIDPKDPELNKHLDSILDKVEKTKFKDQSVDPTQKTQISEQDHKVTRAMESMGKHRLANQEFVPRSVNAQESLADIQEQLHKNDTEKMSVDQRMSVDKKREREMFLSSIAGKLNKLDHTERYMQKKNPAFRLSANVFQRTHSHDRDESSGKNLVEDIEKEHSGSDSLKKKNNNNAAATTHIPKDGEIKDHDSKQGDEIAGKEETKESEKDVSEHSGHSEKKISKTNDEDENKSRNTFPFAKKPGNVDSDSLETAGVSRSPLELKKGNSPSMIFPKNNKHNSKNLSDGTGTRKGPNNKARSKSITKIEYNEESHKIANVSLISVSSMSPSSMRISRMYEQQRSVHPLVRTANTIGYSLGKLNKGTFKFTEQRAVFTKKKKPPTD